MHYLINVFKRFQTVILWFVVLVFFTTVSLPNTYAQKFDWAGSLVSDNSFTVSRMISDDSSNFYVCGIYSLSMDFILSSAADYTEEAEFTSFYLAKYNSNGYLKWLITLQSNYFLNSSLSLGFDQFGNVLLSGGFIGTMDFDPGDEEYILESLNPQDCFIANYSPDGNFLWAKQFGAEGLDRIHFMDTDGSGNMYFAGTFAYVVDFDPGDEVSELTDSGYGDTFLLKLDANGEFEWVRRWTLETFEGYLSDIDAAENGDVTLMFMMDGNIDVDPGESEFYVNTQIDDNVLVHLDSEGQFLWSKTIGNSYDDVARDIISDEEGSIYMAIRFTGVLDISDEFPEGIYDAGESYDPLLIKINSDGQFLWVKHFEGNLDDELRSLAIDPWGNVYTTGFFHTMKMDFNHSENVNYFLEGVDNSKAFVAVYDTYGNFLWARKLTGYGTISGDKVAVDGTGSVVVSGHFDGNLDFNPGSGSYMIETDFTNSRFFVRLNQCNLEDYSTSNFDEEACFSYTVPSENFDAFYSGTYIDIIPNRYGCDSLMVIQLEITSPDAIAVLQNNTLLAMPENLDYQWIECSQNMEEVELATNQVFEPLSNGYYAVVVTQNGCKDTSSCVSVTFVNVPNNDLIQDFTISPNPGTGKFQLACAEDAINLEVVDLAGNIIVQENLQNKPIYSFELNEPSGVYVARLKLKNGTYLYQLFVLN